MVNKDGFRLERMCVGAQEKWRVSRLGFKLTRNTHEEILIYTRFSLLCKHIYMYKLTKVQDVFASKE
jgi:hypothetical protein